ncbi:MAG: folate-binding protein YgfZ [Nitrosomonadales bacterium]|nr:folate-binding protein YgfZ [Nitrosomonadales bacterium]
MNTDWQTFLTQHGASIEAGVVRHFGDTTAELEATAQKTVMCDLGQFGTLRVSGEEAQTFLQNLLSNDIREASNTRAQLSSLNTAKGRMLTTMLIWSDGDDYLLQLPRSQSETIRKKLSMYVLRSKVKITDASDEIISLGLSGSGTQDILRAQCGELPQQRLAAATVTAGSVIKLDDSRFQLNTTMQHAPALWTALARQAKPVGSACWDWLNIRSGLPVILPQTQEQFVAQMVNLELIGGVSFKKGCYPGQEIVARTQYLGKLKRRMYLAHLASSVAPQAGDELFSSDMEGQASGMIVNAAPAPGGGYDVLASVQIASRETQTLRWKSLQGDALQFLPLPYALPDV